MDRSTIFGRAGRWAVFAAPCEIALEFSLTIFILKVIVCVCVNITVKPIHSPKQTHIHLVLRQQTSFYGPKLKIRWERTCFYNLHSFKIVLNVFFCLWSLSNIHLHTWTSTGRMIGSMCGLWPLKSAFEMVYRVNRFAESDNKILMNLYSITTIIVLGQ